MTGESLGDRARPHTHTHKEPTVPSQIQPHLRDGFSTALVASAREGQNETEGSKRHKHTFTALYWHFGPYGRQDVHVHSCFTEGCWRVVIGKGRKCDNKLGSHRRETLHA